MGAVEVVEEMAKAGDRVAMGRQVAAARAEEAKAGGCVAMEG